MFEMSASCAVSLQHPAARKKPPVAAGAGVRGGCGIFSLSHCSVWVVEMPAFDAEEDAAGSGEEAEAASISDSEGRPRVEPKDPGVALSKP